MTRMRLRCGIAVPVLYFATLIGASLTWPGHSHVTQYASELGSAAAPHPWPFNGGILLTGIAALLGGAGVARFFAGLGRPWSGTLAGLALAMIPGIGVACGAPLRKAGRTGRSG